MKKLLYTVIAAMPFCGSSLLMTSCDDLFDTKSPSSMDDSNIFSIYDLAEVSVSKMAKLPPDQFYQMEQIGGCSGAKSSMIKKILLLMNLKEHLQLTIDEDTLTDIDTVSDLLNVLHYNK